MKRKNTTKKGTWVLTPLLRECNDPEKIEACWEEIVKGRPEIHVVVDSEMVLSLNVKVARELHRQLGIAIGDA